MNKRANETTQEYFDRLEKEHIEAVNQNKKAKENKTKKRKGLIVAAWLVLLSVITAITGTLYFKKKNNTENKAKDRIEKEIETDEISLADLGLEEEIVEENEKIYGETTGDVDKKQVVKKDGTIWKNQTAADKSNQVGKVVVDDKNGTLTVKPNGTAVEKDKGYEVKDETGKVTQSGTNQTGTPDDYIWNKEENKGLKEGYVYADGDYYNLKGEKVAYKGQVILKTAFEQIKKTCTTTKPVTNNNQTTTPSTENTQNNNTPETTITETFTPIEGVVNPDGTYTIDGITFESKADYEQWVIQGYEGYAIDIVDGIMKSTDGKTLVKTK